MSVLPDIVITPRPRLLIRRPVGEHHQIAISNLPLRAPVPTTMDEVGRPEGSDR
ncbi:hypothetical protein [Nitratireductor rhodophyticola]|uniref:hypothetical protein n=1 Tax=Nitratireductor rhodophyticola TaxID=2854036 RepID=UPI003BA8E99D